MREPRKPILTGVSPLGVYVSFPAHRRTAKCKPVGLLDARERAEPLFRICRSDASGRADLTNRQIAPLHKAIESGARDSVELAKFANAQKLRLHDIPSNKEGYPVTGRVSEKPRLAPSNRSKNDDRSPVSNSNQGEILIHLVATELLCSSLVALWLEHALAATLLLLG